MFLNLLFLFLESFLLKIIPLRSNFKKCTLYAHALATSSTSPYSQAQIH
jgi:hypothetical protein